MEQRNTTSLPSARRATLHTVRHHIPRRRRRHGIHRRHTSLRRSLSALLPFAVLHHTRAQDGGRGIPGPNETYVPLRVTNNCPDTVWPGIGTQHGLGPGLGGFELVGGETMAFLVGPTWQGRVWGRTNCSFNANGTGPDNLNGVNGLRPGEACLTGDCFGVLDCAVTVSFLPSPSLSSQPHTDKRPRARPPPPSPSSTSAAAPATTRPSTTSPS